MNFIDKKLIIIKIIIAKSYIYYNAMHVTAIKTYFHACEHAVHESMDSVYIGTPLLWTPPFTGTA